MITSRLDLDDAAARERAAILALRRADMASLQRLAEASPSLGWRVARRMIDGGALWAPLAWADVQGRFYEVPFPEVLRARSIQAVSIRNGALIVATVPWLDRERRLFACDCADRVLPLFERAYPDDPRPRQAIRVARAYARGEASEEELTAANDAAQDVVEETLWDSIRDTADAAAEAAASPEDLHDAVWRAAEGAADAAADEAANRGDGEVAGWDTERDWQRDRLLEYLLGEVAP